MIQTRETRCYVGIVSELGFLMLGFLKFVILFTKYDTLPRIAFENTCFKARRLFILKPVSL